MGSVAAKYCRTIILTNEDPYDEDPQAIITQIKSGVVDDSFDSKNLIEIIDRQVAIAKATQIAKTNDVVIITGKGSESFIHLANGHKLPWNEKEVVQKALQSLKKSKKVRSPKIRR